MDNIELDLVHKVNLIREVAGTVDSVASQLTQLLVSHGFLVLSRVDLSKRLEEKLGKKMPAVSILGAYDPEFSYRAFAADPDAASVLGIRVVIRDVGRSWVSVEIVKPTEMMELIGEKGLEALALDAESRLIAVLNDLP